MQQAVELREALRRLLQANNGAALERDAIEALNEAISDATLSVSFDARRRQAGARPCAGRARAPWSPRSWRSSTRRWSNGTWERLKVCPADDCQWAFYDESKNRSGTWCDMAGLR